MDSTELRNALEDAGLSQYQAEAYTTLLQLGTASATEIADSCAVPNARIYDVLRDLETKGYIETYEQESLQARACDPAVVLEDLRGRASMLEEAADEIEERWDEPEVDQHKLSIVKRFETVIQRAASLIRDADNEVQLAATPKQYEELKPALREALSNDVLVKATLYTDSDASLDVEFDGTATEVRHRTLPTPFVVLIDRTGTCFAPHSHSLNEYGVLVDDYTLTYVFHWYFQTCLWEVWEEVYSVRPTDPPLVYSDLRRCIREIEPFLDDGAEITARVNGYETETGDAVEIEGRIVDVNYAGAGETEGSPPLSQLAGRVCFTVETGDGGGRYTVGGWGAVLENVEATRITVLECSA
ncbi:TrmB family transcriptional regulator [Halopelagius longus]|uniref:Transcriptional regulator n=1 Tax=Halopelagius longus TaxID=1236180 RepID=A0A1H1B9U2_9EURY|nr:TrmB family transcriptional regulator [Halopelagius longus]RDI70697.1 TrmB family transcriptional regulator [Halopelagius longus]SDQ48581.1 transcriptional regulator [Halopelagius longus]